MADAATLRIVDDLKALAGDVLGRGIERMFDGADDLLFEMARRASNNKDQRIYFDTMRVVRLGRPKIGKIFRDHIAAGFDPATPRAHASRAAEIPFEDLRLQESKSLEESIAVSTMANKAEHLFGHLLFELARRLEWLIKQRHAPIAPQALAPGTISEAFRRSAETLDVDFDVELVIFKLFDQLVISDLGELYTRVLGLLEQHKVQASAIAGTPPRSARPVDGAAAMRSVGATLQTSAGHLPLPVMDAATLDLLRNLGAARGNAMASAASAAYYGDLQLGTELAMAASGVAVPGWDAPRTYAYVQRASAVGQMFNELMQDPSLPAPLKPRFDQLRFSVIKSALKDVSFFADHLHPVRGLINELSTLAASARASGPQALQRIEELVGEIQSQFEIAAEEIRAQLTEAARVDEGTLERFFAQHREDARQRRKALLERTRRVVAEELQLRTLTRHVPSEVWPLLNSGWAPLAALQLLKQGADSEAWRQSMALLDRILDSLDVRRPEARTEQGLRETEETLDARLREIGMPDERRLPLLRHWRDAAQQVEARAVAEAATPLPAATPDPSSSGPEGADAESTDARADSEASRASALAQAPLQPADPAAPAAKDTTPDGPSPASDAIALLDLLMVLSSWFRVYDHDRGQNRWLKVVAHQPAESLVVFSEFNGQNKLQLNTQVFLDDLVAGRAEPIDLGPAARRALDNYLGARRAAAEAQDAKAA